MARRYATTLDRIHTPEVETERARRGDVWIKLAQAAYRGTTRIGERVHFERTGRKPLCPKCHARRCATMRTSSVAKTISRDLPLDYLELTTVAF